MRLTDVGNLNVINHDIDNTLRAFDIESNLNDDANVISCRLKWENSSRVASFSFPNPDTRLCIRVHDEPDRLELLSRSQQPHDATPFLPLLTMLAGSTSSNLIIEGTVDEVAFQGAKKAASVVSKWWGWTGGEIEAHEVTPLVTHSRNSSVGLFFSRGLDSMSSLLTMIAQDRPPDWLLGVDWIDLPLAGPDFESIFDGTRRAADSFGIPLIRLTSNARLWLDQSMTWDLSVGAFLASSALRLNGLISEAGISSALPLGWEGMGRGHDPRLDPLWSSSSVRIAHRHDVSGGRIDRARVVAKSPAALSHLKVCWERSGDGNCGTCRKCVLTLADLWLAGAAEESTQAFGHQLSESSVSKLKEIMESWNPLFDEVFNAFFDIAKGRLMPPEHYPLAESREFARSQARAWNEIKGKIEFGNPDD